MAKKNITVEVFPDSAEVTIKVDGDLYSRITEMLFETTLSVDVKNLDEHFTNIMANEPKNRYEYHMSTLLHLVALIENEVRANNLAVKKDIEVDDEDEPSSSEKPD
jgi:hypothetical protein